MPVPALRAGGTFGSPRLFCDYGDTTIMDKSNLDYWLETITVSEPGSFEPEFDVGPPGWWAVVNEDGICAYFGKEVDAFRFRLAEINRRLNG